MDSPENIAFYEDIGRVKFVRHKRARNMTIRINQNGEVRVTFPRHVSRRRAEAFLISRKPWIAKKLSEIDSMGIPVNRLKEGYRLKVDGKEIPLIQESRDQSMEDVVWRILRKEAKSILPDRVEELATRHGFQYNGLKIRKMRTRWGSCTARNSLNLNSWLVMLPQHLSDYVILHELVHTVHKDHSRRFWSTLDRVTGYRSMVLRRELRGQRIMYFPGTVTASRHQKSVPHSG